MWGSILKYNFVSCLVSIFVVCNGNIHLKVGKHKKKLRLYDYPYIKSVLAELPWIFLSLEALSEQY